MYAGISRRHFLALCGSLATGATEKPLRGIFPIAQSPFNDKGALDLEALAAQIRFLDRCGAHGAVWPQLASEWDTLSNRERMEGAEAIAATGRKLKLAVVLGVQSPDPAAAVLYAQRAERLGADAIISLPPKTEDPKAVLEYYKQVGSATQLPLFAQAVGKVTPEQLLDMYRTIPTLRYVKDEAGQPLDRIGQLLSGSEGRLKVFSGSHGRTLIEEMRRGFSGSMPAAAFADLYAQTWDLWQAGQHKEAMEMHGRTLLVLTDMGLYGLEGLKYPLVLRGVFQTWKTRQDGGKLTEAGMKSLREAVEFSKPFLRA
ncbi:dihydrodipicolinate synthase family protein [Paludibaculum fermentans]|uniref:dihydrodipicolinate synthase family protein n=1 Tax=Paludibaculum fermentans TaxID=1473598 RepID=UPI003EB9766F